MIPTAIPTECLRMPDSHLCSLSVCSLYQKANPQSAKAATVLEYCTYVFIESLLILSICGQCFFMTENVMTVLWNGQTVLRNIPFGTTRVLVLVQCIKRNLQLELHIMWCRLTVYWASTAASTATRNVL
jgi:hypothetical protein